MVEKNDLMKHLPLGLTLGVIWGISAFIIALIPNYGVKFVEILASIYPGYGKTQIGAIGGLLYGFIDGFIGGFLISFLYNFFKEKLK